MKTYNSLFRKAIQLCTLFLILSVSLNAQNVAINTDGAAPSTSAILDVKSANKGMLIPRVSLTGLTDASTISSPATSLMVYNTATAGSGTNEILPGYYYWNGTQWTSLSFNPASQGTLPSEEEEDCENGIYTITEDFETGLGIFSNVTGDNFDWTRFTGATPTAYTGPNAAQSGSYYVYTEATGPSYGQFAYLETSFLTLSSYQAGSISFYYFKEGTGGNLSGLAFEVNTSSTGGTWTTLLTTTTTYPSASWLSATVDISSYLASGARFRFKMTRGTDDRCDFAIDNFVIECFYNADCRASDINIEDHFTGNMLYTYNPLGNFDFSPSLAWNVYDDLFYNFELGSGANKGLWTIAQGGGYLGRPRGSLYGVIKSGLFGNLIYETTIRVNSAVAHTEVNIGLGDGSTDFGISPGLYFRYKPGASANWQLVSRNSAETVVTTTTAVTLNTFLKLKIVINSVNSKAYFFVNGTYVGSPSGTNYPSTSGVYYPFWETYDNTAGPPAARPSISVDYFRLHIPQ